MPRKKIREYVDAQQMHLEYQATFEVPSKKELDEIQPDMYVKVGVLTGDKEIDTERFWTKIVTVKSNVITATVENDLMVSDLELGEIITFEKKNIYSIQ